MQIKKLLIFFLLSFSLFAVEKKNPLCELKMSEETYQVPNPALWKTLYDFVNIHVDGTDNPMINANLNWEKTYEASSVYAQELPVYREIVKLRRKKESIPIDLHNKVTEEIITSATKFQDGNFQNKELGFALQEAIRNLSFIDAHVVKENEKTPEEQRQEDQENKEQEKQEQQEKPEESQDEQEQGEQGEGQGESAEETDPWKSLPDEYKPENTNLERGDSQKAFGMMARAEIGADHTHWSGKIYENTTLKKMTPDYIVRPKRVRDESGKRKKLKVFAGNERKFDIVVPELHTIEKVVTPGVKLIEHAPEEFSLVIPDGLKEVDLEIRDAGGDTFKFNMPDDMKRLAEHSGAKAELWPENLRAFVESLKAKNLPTLKIASELERYFRLDGGFRYYSVGKELKKEDLNDLDKEFLTLLKQYPEPIALAHLGAFNCDGATWISSIVLRDFFGIPTRGIGGMTTAYTKNFEGVNNQVLDSRAPLHMWLEVYDKGKWHRFDMQPEFKADESSEGGDGLPSESEKDSSKSDSSNSQSPSKDSEGEGQDKEGQDKEDEGSDTEVIKDNQNLTGEKDKKSGEQQPESSPDTENTDKENKEAGDESGNSLVDKTSDIQTHDKSEDSNDSSKSVLDDLAKFVEDVVKDKVLEEAPKDSGEESTKEQESEAVKESKDGEQSLIDLLESVDRSSDSNRLYELFFKALYSRVLEKSIMYKGRDVIFSEALGFTKNINEKLREPRLVAEAEIANETIKSQFVSQKDLLDLNLDGHLGQVKSLISRGRIREAWQELIGITKIIEELATIRNLSADEHKFLSMIKDILRDFETIKHEDSDKFEMVANFVRQLPGGISKTYLSKEYPNYLTLGHPSLDKVAQDLNNGTLQVLVRMAMFKDYIDMYLNSMMQRSYDEVKTAERNLVPQAREKDIVVTDNPYEFNKYLLDIQPGEHIFAKAFRNEQFAIGSKVTKKIASPRKTSEKKISVLEIDISHSMDGNELLVQDALILAFIDKALSEVDIVGNQLHEVYVVPFESKVHEPIPIRTRAQAIEFLRARVNSPTRPSGGTDITKALVKFYELVKRANDENDANPKFKKFRKANLILFSDGGDTIDMDKVLVARKEIPKELHIIMNFIGIGSSNSAIEKLSKDTSLSDRESTVKVLSHGEMNQIVSASQKVSIPEVTFATDMNALPQSIRKKLNDLMNFGANFMVDYQPQVDQIRQDLAIGPEARPTAHGQSLEALAKVINNSSISNGLRATLIVNLVKAYEKYSGKNINQLTKNEYKHFRSLLKE